MALGSVGRAAKSVLCIAGALLLATLTTTPSFAYAPSDYEINFIYFSPGRASDQQDLADRKARLDEIINDPRTPVVGQDKMAEIAAERELLNAGQRSATWWEPRDGSKYPGSDGEAAFAARAAKVKQMTDDVLDFYEYHTGVRPRAKFTPVIGEESAMHYWLYGDVTPMGDNPSSFNFNSDPAPGRIFDELGRRGIVQQPDRLIPWTPAIKVLLADGLGGWAGSMPVENFGGTAMLGDFATACAGDRASPEGDGSGPRPDDSAALRAKMPAHIADWVSCNYDMATGSTAHELGHTFGLPHTISTGCPGPSGALVMSSHWNYRLHGPGFMYDFGFDNDFRGILKRYDPLICDPNSEVPPWDANYREGVGTTMYPNAHFHSELDLLMANPHFNSALIPDLPPEDEPGGDDPPNEEPPAVEPPADNPPVDELPDEPPVDEPPLDVPPNDTPQDEEPPVEQPPTDSPPAEQPPAPDTPSPNAPPTDQAPQDPTPPLPKPDPLIFQPPSTPAPTSAPTPPVASERPTQRTPQLTASATQRGGTVTFGTSISAPSSDPIRRLDLELSSAGSAVPLQQLLKSGATITIELVSASGVRSTVRARMVKGKVRAFGPDAPLISMRGKRITIRFSSRSLPASAKLSLRLPRPAPDSKCKPLTATTTAQGRSASATAAAERKCPAQSANGEFQLAAPAQSVGGSFNAN